MRKKLLRNITACLALAVILFQSCKDDSKLTIPPPPADASFNESFDNFSEALQKGWVNINKSSPLGPTLYDVAEVPDFGSPNYVSVYYPKWEQAQLTLDSTQFPNAPYPKRYWKDAFFSQRGSNGYAATSQANTIVWSAGHDVNSWLVSPQVTMKNGDKISFYSYCSGKATLQLFINPTGSLYLADGYGDYPGDFKIKLVDIPNTSAEPHTVYPNEWTKFEGTVSGLNGPVTGRFGFRYFLQNQPAFPFSSVDQNNLDTIFQQVHNTIIGLDEVSFKSAQ